MKISNLKIYKKLENCKYKIGALSLAGMLTLVGLTGCSNEKDVPYEIVETRRFEPGQHIISVPTGDPKNANMQYPFHEGYKCVGIGTTAYGQHGSTFGGACLLYVNDYPVECSSSYHNDDEIVFYDFGQPIGYEKYDGEETDEYQVFGPGEHIISTPIPYDTQSYQIFYNSHEGYEPVGIATSAYGKYGAYYGGGCILFVNTEPVKCKKVIDYNGNVVYTKFGEVLQKTK